MARKTFEILSFKLFVNQQLANPYCPVAEKIGWCTSLEWVLGETGTYKGFNYLIQDGVRPCLEDAEPAKCTNPEFTQWHSYMRFYY